MISGNLQDRHTVHEAAVQNCKDVLGSLGMVWRQLHRDELQDSIRGVDLVVTVGGDGTLLQASHFLDSSIPVLGVNSDPTQMSEVEEKLEDFDATRSAGYLCAATKENFEHVLQEIQAQKRIPSHVHRISIRVNGSTLRSYALNDVLLAHPNPAAVTRCSLGICKANNSGFVSPVVHARSSGLRVCTGIGSTAAMQSAGGFVMSQLSKDLQYMVREPISPSVPNQQLMHNFVRADEVLRVKFSGRQGVLYVDGCHLHYKVGFDDVIEFSTQAPQLQLFLRNEAV
ncbi:hypothetical protein GOP47_0007086 [Adiantum capillus-veneris]|uniref:NADH kinase n=1 Tax=Adiantum capillus-veneris TaxID=13818 RepID=A0A9D4V1G4_ADICA|nr:hypothetical protein GOP47_0007086 [Adiantum capillus-veneris]